MIYLILVYSPPYRPSASVEIVQGINSSPAQFLSLASGPNSLPEVTIIHSPAPSLFALIIGISKYRHPEVPDLPGAANDANTVKRFLTSEVGISKERIVNLRDEQATWRTILEALHKLARESAISMQDPILIYYAGHGAEAPSPVPGWEASSPNGMIQMLVPHDFTFEGSKEHRGQGIFDINLSQILEEIARNKSDNITVILDCCHLGSGTRKHASNRTLAVRGINLPPKYSIPVDLLGMETSGGLIHKIRATRSSHVLLAACKQGQYAMEREGCGVFTLAFLTLLKQEGIDKLAYMDVIMRLPDLPLQNPQCKGVNQQCVLFDSKVHNRHLTLHCICKMPGERNKYTLEAGEAHGVTKGMVFAVYRDKLATAALGSVIAFHTTPFASRCLVVGSISFPHQPVYAVQTRVGAGNDLCLFIELNDTLCGFSERLLQEMQSETSRPSFRLVYDEQDHPDLVLRTEGGLVQFKIKDPISCQYGLTRMLFNDVQAEDSDYLISILCSVADFYRYLRHLNKNGSLTQNVHVKCLELEQSGQLTDDLEDIFVPKGDNQNLVVDNTVFVPIDNSGDNLQIYGFQITNLSDDPLYAALFYFDASDLSIAANDQVDFPLPSNGSLAIGFGDSGWPARTYYLCKNQSVDVGFLKLYVSVKYVDYSGVVQNTPFHGRRRGNTLPSRSKARWDALIIPIIQRKVLSVDRAGMGPENA
ncbi:hypothetical protein DXG01_007621 [Tephrocybe rancida]|nr:hypothetical protein DXG01_007621 [Tephrocybe rancida]